MSYFYNGVDISNLIDTTGSSVPPNYGGFPTSKPHTYTGTGLDKPAIFSYSYQGSDVSNYATAYNLSYTSGADTIPTSITGAPGYNFKHISAYCWGGGGGGGGGGGAGQGANIHGGGDGGTGGTGGYAAIVSYPISGNAVKYQVGTGGKGGVGGAGADPSFYNEGKNGNGGSNGNQSYVQVGGINIITGKAGNGGSGGDSGNAEKSPGKAKNGDSTEGSYNESYRGTTIKISAAHMFPKQTGGNGGGSGGGAPNGGPNPKDGSDGGAGNAGYVRVYLTYQ
jgi:hypothetical protein